MYGGYPITLDSDKLNQRPNDFRCVFNQPLFLGDRRWEIALIKLFTWYSWFNISASLYQNNTFRYSTDSGSTWKTVTIDDGQYSISQLNDKIHFYMFQNGDYNTTSTGFSYEINLIPDFSTLKIYLSLGTTYRIDLSVSELYYLLGFNKAIYTTSLFAPNVANITNDINSLKVTCSIVESSYDSAANSNVLSIYTPNVGPGSQIIIEPFQPIYVPVISSRTLTDIRVTITDNLDRPIDFNGEPSQILLYLRPKMQ